MFHPQFSTDSEQYYRVKGSWKPPGGSLARQKGQNKGTRKGKGKGSGKEDPASGGAEPLSRVIGHAQFQNRILRMSPQNQNEFWVWEGPLISLPRFMHALGTTHTAADLYRFYRSLNVMVNIRPHSWSSVVRIEAARARFKETGRYGFPRG